MITLLHDLIRHKGYADATLLSAISAHEEAAQDPELHQRLHHIILANRFWLMLSLRRPFAMEEESQIPESLEKIVGRYQETYAEETAWISQLQESDLDRKLETPFIPGKSFSLAQAWMQVCMHSHGHRSQCATRLRLLGGTPPTLDFILWLKERPAPAWP